MVRGMWHVACGMKVNMVDKGDGPKVVLHTAQLADVNYRGRSSSDNVGDSCMKLGAQRNRQTHITCGWDKLKLTTKIFTGH